MDGFAKGSADGRGSDEFAVGYYLKRDLGFIPHVADAYTLYDRYFHSVMASTYPNRHYQLAAQSGERRGTTSRWGRSATSGRRSSIARRRAA